VIIIELSKLPNLKIGILEN